MIEHWIAVKAAREPAFGLFQKRFYVYESVGLRQKSEDVSRQQYSVQFLQSVASVEIESNDRVNAMESVRDK